VPTVRYDILTGASARGSGSRLNEENAMRSVLPLGLFIDDSFCQRRAGASLQAARAPLTPDPTCYRPQRLCGSGWTDEETRYWMDNATVVPEVVVPH